MDNLSVSLFLIPLHSLQIHVEIFFFLMYIAALTLYFAKFPFCVLTWCALWTYNSLQLALLSRGL